MKSNKTNKAQKEPKYICPVCGFNGLKEAPYGPNQEPSYEICSNCGVEFGFDDRKEGKSHEQ
jgi:transcription elongation factor Elf1